MKHIAIVSIVAGALVVAGAPADAQSKVSPYQLPLSCALQVPNAVLTNGWSASIPKGTKVTVKYTQKLIGSFGIPYFAGATVEKTLPTAWPHGQTLQVGLYSPDPRPCTASFDAGPPDLQVVQVTKGAAVVTVAIRNNNAFIDAPASTTQVRYMKCSQVVLSSMSLQLISVPKGSARLLNFNRPFPAGYQYLDVFADVTNTIAESNENNNVHTEVGVCIK